MNDGKIHNSKEWCEAFGELLDIESPWRVTAVDLSHKQDAVRVRVSRRGSQRLRCPKCERSCPGYDFREREWRHLDLFEYKTFVVAEVPRVECPEHGVVTLQVPWAQGSSRFTAKFETVVIDWLLETSVAAVSRQLGLSWNAIDGIKQRAVRRGLGRRQAVEFKHLCVDETSFRKRHDYVTVASDPERGGRVLHVADGRTKKELSQWYQSLPAGQLEAIESVSMDMWKGYINATFEHVPDAHSKIAFDRFHVARHLNEAVDKVRRQENRVLMGVGDGTLKGSRFKWLKSSCNMSHKQKIEFKSLRDSSLKTARAYAIKEMASGLWRYRSRTWALKGWQRWLTWALRCRLEPVRAVAKMVRSHLWGIVNAAVLDVSNGPAESVNSKIKMIKVKSRGYRNKQRFIDDIYFHLGGLDLYPEQCAV